MHPYVSMTYKCTTAPERSTYNNINKYIYILPYWITKIKARFNKLYKCRFLYKKGNYKKAQPDFLVWNVPGSCYLHACMRDKETFLERRWFTHSFQKCFIRKYPIRSRISFLRFPVFSSIHYSFPAIQLYALGQLYRRKILLRSSDKDSSLSRLQTVHAR